MPQETDRLKLPLPLGNENVTRESINGIFEKIDAGVATQADLDTLREAVGKMDIPDASLTQKGKVQLSDAINSTMKDKAATPSAVKLAFDEAIAAKQLGVEQKNNVVAALNSIGVTASTSESWAQLIPKMTGVIRATGNATAAQVLSGATFSNATGNVRVGTMPNRSAANHHQPSTSYTVWSGDRVFLQPPDGYYTGESWVTADAPSFKSENIANGIDIMGVVGSYKGRMIASDNIVHRGGGVNYFGGTPTERIGLTFNVPGTVRFSFTISSSANNSFAQVYINGIAYGTRWTAPSIAWTRTEDITLSAGDRLSIYTWCTSGGSTVLGTVTYGNDMFVVNSYS